jgi:hypothetical protein
MLADDFDDFRFRLQVDLADEIVLALGAHFEAVQAVHAADDDFARATRGADRNIDQGLHSRPRAAEWERAAKRQALRGRVE